MKSLLYFKKNRHATWLEHFFDLAFVVLIGRMIHILAHSAGKEFQIEYITKFPLLFIPIWWIWGNHTIYSNIYDRDSKEHRVATLVIMLLMICLSVFIDMEEGYKWFIMVYSCIRGIISVLYFIASKKYKETRIHAHAHGVIYSIGAIIGLVSISFTGEIRFIILYVSIFVDIFTPIIFKNRIEYVSAHRGHLIDRTGMLTIIILGESVISLANSIQSLDWNIYNITATVAGFILIGGVWWVIFDFYYLLSENKNIKSYFIIMIPNLLMHMGLAVIANIIQHSIWNDLNIGIFRIMLLSGVIIFFVGKQTPYFYGVPKIRRKIIENTFVVFFMVVIVSNFKRLEWILVGFTVTMLVYIVLTLRYMINLGVSKKHISESKEI